MQSAFIVTRLLKITILIIKHVNMFLIGFFNVKANVPETVLYLIFILFELLLLPSAVVGNSKNFSSFQPDSFVTC